MVRSFNSWGSVHARCSCSGQCPLVKISVLKSTPIAAIYLEALLSLKSIIISFEFLMSANIDANLLTVLWPHSTFSFWSISSSASCERNVLFNRRADKCLVYDLMKISRPCRQQNKRMMASSREFVSVSLIPLSPFLSSLSQ